MKTEGRRERVESVPKPIWKNRGRKDDPISDAPNFHDEERKQVWGVRWRGNGHAAQFRKSCLFTHNFYLALQHCRIMRMNLNFCLSRSFHFPLRYFLCLGARWCAHLYPKYLQIFSAPLVTKYGTNLVFPSVACPLKYQEFLVIFILNWINHFIIGENPHQNAGSWLFYLSPKLYKIPPCRQFCSKHHAEIVLHVVSFPLYTSSTSPRLISIL